MAKSKIVIVVAGGVVQSVFVPKDSDVDVETVDFDSTLLSEYEQTELGDYVDECRNTMKEVIC